MPAFATLDEFLHKLVGDLGATTTAALVGIGDKLGLYRDKMPQPMTLYVDNYAIGQALADVDPSRFDE